MSRRNVKVSLVGQEVLTFPGHITFIMTLTSTMYTDLNVKNIFGFDDLMYLLLGLV